MQIIASAESDPDDDACDSARPSARAARPASRPINDGGGGVLVDGPPARLSQERGGGAMREPEGTLEAMRAACAEGPAWMLEVSAECLALKLGPTHT